MARLNLSRSFFKSETTFAKSKVRSLLFLVSTISVGPEDTVLANELTWSWHLDGFLSHSFRQASRGSSQLDLRELVGGFDELAIACGAWDPDKRIILGGSKQPTANPHRAADEGDRPAPSNRRAGVPGNSSLRRPVSRL
jgi:hypothetical protein